MYASKLPFNSGLQIVQRLLAEKVKLNIRVPEGSPDLPQPLSEAELAIKSQRVSQLQRLRSFQEAYGDFSKIYAQSIADQETSLFVGYTSLFFAAANGNDLVVEALLATNKVDIKQIDALGETALHKLSTPRVAGLLLNAKADMNFPNKFGDSAWSTLIMTHGNSNNHFDLVKLFLENGADPNKSFETDWYKRYPIHFTATTEYMDLLMKHHADINSVDRYGQTLLFTLDDRELGTENLILLIKHAVAVHHADVTGEMFGLPTILTKSMWSKHWYDIDERFGDFLIAHGADAEHISSDGFSDFMTAVLAENYKAVRSLLKAGVNKDLTPKFGRLAGHAIQPKPLIADLLNDPEPSKFCDLGFFNVAEEGQDFKFRRGNPNLLNSHGETALFVASRCNECDWLEKVWYTAAYQCDIKPNLELPNPDGIAPMHIAIRMGNSIVVMWLLEQGVSCVDDSQCVREVINFLKIDDGAYEVIFKDSPPWTIELFFKNKYDEETGYDSIPPLIPMTYISPSGESILLMAEKAHNDFLVDLYLRSVEEPVLVNTITGESFFDFARGESKEKFGLLIGHPQTV